MLVFGRVERRGAGVWWPARGHHFAAGEYLKLNQTRNPQVPIRTSRPKNILIRTSHPYPAQNSHRFPRKPQPRVHMPDDYRRLYLIQVPSKGAKSWWTLLRGTQMPQKCSQVTSQQEFASLQRPTHHICKIQPERSGPRLDRPTIHLGVKPLNRYQIHIRFAYFEQGRWTTQFHHNRTYLHERRSQRRQILLASRDLTGV